MLKVCKSANKSVLEDAVDHNNTAVTLTGCEQPDEDDYGFVSQEASAYYNKMMEKYLIAPEEEKFPSAKKRSSSDLLGTKDRVRQALILEKEEELIPHKRQRKSKSEGVPYEVDSRKSSSKRNDKDFYRQPEKKPESKPKHRRPAPPPLAFNELLKIAEKKAQEPIKIETIIEVKKAKEPERLMTSKEKHKAWLDQRAEREKLKSQNNYKSDKNKNNGQNISDTSNQRDRGRNKEVEKVATKPQSSGPVGRIPKFNGYQAKPMHNGKQSSNNVSDRNYSASNGSKIIDKNNSQKYAPPKDESSKLCKTLTSGSRNGSISNKDDYNKNSVVNKSVHSAQRQNQISLSASKSKDVPNRNNSQSSSSQNMKPRSSDGGKPRQFPSSSDTKGIRQPSSNGVKPSDKGGNRTPSDKIARSSTSNNIKGTRPIPSSDAKTIRQFPPPDVERSRQFPPPDVKSSRQFLPKDVKSTRQFPPQDVRRKQISHRDGQRKSMGSNSKFIQMLMIQIIKLLFSLTICFIFLGRIFDDDDDSEYDSEIDDFIDDGPEEEEDYSKHIKEIFGYDKSRYVAKAVFNLVLLKILNYYYL